MVLADQIPRNLAIPRITGTTSKIITLDIERVKGELVHEFWDLGEAKRISRFDYSEVSFYPRTILVCWKDYFTDTVEAASEWAHGADGMHERVWRALNAADIVVGHNLDRFDLPKLHGYFAEHGWGEPLPYKTVDTLKHARKLGYESNTLGALTERFGIATKTDRYDHDTAKRALDGSKRDQKTLIDYCKGDVVATEGLFDWLRPRIKNHPHLRGLPWREDTATHCVYCGSTNIEKQTESRLAVVLTYPLWRCGDCSGLFELTRNDGRVGRVRGAGR